MSTPTQNSSRPRKGACTVEPLREKRDLNAIKGALADRPRDFALFVVGIHVGLRGCDLLRLRWRDVLALDGRSIAERVSVTESKTGKTRQMTLQDNPRKALAHLLRGTPSAAADDFVFRSREGAGPISVQRLNQMLKMWTRAAGVPGRFGAHTLRKTFGYHLRKAGYDIGLLMQIFGHSHPAVTRRYLGITQDEIDSATLKLNL